MKARKLQTHTIEDIEKMSVKPKPRPIIEYDYRFRDWSVNGVRKTLGELVDWMIAHERTH